MAALSTLDWAVTRQSQVFGSDNLLPGETVAVRAEAREFADDKLRPIAHELNTTPERRDGFRRDIFQAIADADLFAVPFAQDVGGRGLEFPTLGTMSVLEELAYYTPGIASSMYDAHVLLFGKVLDSAGGTLRKRYLPRLIKGEFVGSFATSEPDTSTDLSAPLLGMRFSVVADTVSSVQCRAPIKTGRSNRSTATLKSARSMKAPTRFRNGLSRGRFSGET